MKLVALLLLFAVIGKMSAAPYPYRVGYYRAVAVQPQQQDNPQPQAEIEEDEEQEDDVEEVSEEDFSNNNIQDDDDSEEHELPPSFHKLFPLPQRNSPGYNFRKAYLFFKLLITFKKNFTIFFIWLFLLCTALGSMMSEISAQGWKVPKHPQQIPKQRARNEIEARDDDDEEDDDEDSNEDEDEEDDVEDDLPDWNRLFPQQGSLEQHGPPADVVDTSSQPEVGAAFRSGFGNNPRIVYVPARSFRQYHNRAVVRPSYTTTSRQYVMRHPTPPRSQVIYNVPTSPMRRNQQMVLASSMNRRPQQSVIYMPVRRNMYSPYTSMYVPRYRY